MSLILLLLVTLALAAASNGGGRAAIIRQIPPAWCFTLPLAALLAFGAAHIS